MKIVVSILVVFCLFFCVLISVKYNRPGSLSKPLKGLILKSAKSIGEIKKKENTRVVIEQKKRKQNRKTIKQKEERNETVVTYNLFFSLV